MSAESPAEPVRDEPEASASERAADGRVVRFKGYQLSHFQIRAVDAIEQGKDVLVSAPTGAGKTLVAEYAIEQAVRKGKRCIYTAPVKALSNQKYRDFRDDPDVDVGIMTGDVTIHPRAQVLIMTTEILRNSIFESPTALDDVEYVIFDEVHYMDDLERGSVWEESLIFCPPEIRFICLSATISNVEQLGAWVAELRGHGMEVIRSEKRPVPLTHRFFTERSGTFDLGRIERVRAQELGGGKRSGRGGRGGRGGGGRRGGGRDRGRGGRPQQQRGTDLRSLIDSLENDGLLPALVFSFSRKDCERLAYRNQRRQLLDDAESARMEALQRELLELFQLGEGELSGEIFQLARRGIGYHHAGMLPVHKEIVERMFTSGLLKLLFTTETFAIGINMPARTVVFAALRKFDGVRFDFMRTRDYLQMAGRAGRQGIDRDGLVVSALDAQHLEEAPVQRLVNGKPEPVVSRFRLAYSTLLHLLERTGRERLFEAWERSFHNYQHRAKSKKAREHARRAQHEHIRAHLEFLEDLGYIEDGERITAKGRVARCLHGYEVQVTELLWRGALENLPPTALAMVFVSMIYEERRRFGGEQYLSPRFFGGVRRHVDQVVGRLARREAEFGVPTPMKRPDWGLTPAVKAWVEGCEFAELEEVSDATPGDICRTFRMALQLTRQVRQAIDPAWDLVARLDDVHEALNRDEVDARRQLELG